MNESAAGARRDGTLETRRSGQGGTILIIDDDREIGDVVAMNLRDLGFRTERANDGRAGLQRALGGGHSLIILDLMLPEMDGLSVCRRIREKNPYTPILMLTAKSEEVDRVLGLELGADEYMTKPFSVRELMARVKALLRRVEADREAAAGKPAGGRVQAGEISIDFEKRKVTLAGQDGRAHGQGVRPAGPLCPQPGPDVQQDGPSQPRLGLPVRRLRPHGQLPYQPPARQDRGRPRPPALPEDGLGRRVPVCRAGRALGMMGVFRSFYARISTIFLLLIVVLGAGWVAIAFNSARQLFSAVEQALNREYARSIAAEIQPLVAGGFDEARVRGAIHYMMVLNPMVEIYLLDAEGKILAYFTGPSDRVVRSSVDMGPVRRFIQSGGEQLILGDDPRGEGRAKPFSAAPLAMGAAQGYVYIILGGEHYDATLRMIRQSYILRAGMVALLLALLSTLIVGLSLFFLLTRPLRALSEAVRAFERGERGRRVSTRGRDELAGLARSFNEMAATIEADMEKLREAERMRKELIGNISHDLRSPLASIRGYLETILLKDELLPPEERRRFIEISLKNTASLQRLVEELFELVKLDTRQVQLKREPFQVAELAQDAVLKLKPGADNAGSPSRWKARGTFPWCRETSGWWNGCSRT